MMRKKQEHYKSADIIEKMRKIQAHYKYAATKNAAQYEKYKLLDEFSKMLFKLYAKEDELEYLPTELKNKIIKLCKIIQKLELAALPCSPNLN